MVKEKKDKDTDTAEAPPPPRIVWAQQYMGSNGPIIRLYLESRPFRFPTGEEATISDTITLTQHGVELNEIPTVPEQGNIVQLKPVDPNDYRRPVEVKINVKQKKDLDPLRDEVGSVELDPPGTVPLAVIEIRLYETDEEPRLLDPSDLPPIPVPAR